MNLIKLEDVRVTIFFRDSILVYEKFNDKKPLSGFNKILKNNVLCKRVNINGNSKKHSTLFNELYKQECITPESTNVFTDNILSIINHNFTRDSLREILQFMYDNQQNDYQQNESHGMEKSFIKTKNKIDSSKTKFDLYNEIKKNKDTFNKTLLSGGKDNKDLKFQLVNFIFEREDLEYHNSLKNLLGNKELNILKQENNEKSTISIHDIYKLEYFKINDIPSITFIAMTLNFQNIEIEYDEKSIIDLLKHSIYKEMLHWDKIDSKIVGKYIEIMNYEPEELENNLFRTLNEGKSKLTYNADSYKPSLISDNYQLYINSLKNITIENKFSGWNDKDPKIHIYGLCLAYKLKYNSLSEELAFNIDTYSYKELETYSQKLLKFLGSFAFKNPTTSDAFNSFYEKLEIDDYENELNKRTQNMLSSLKVDYEREEKVKQNKLNTIAIVFTIFGGITAIDTIPKIVYYYNLFSNYFYQYLTLNN